MNRFRTVLASTAVLMAIGSTPLQAQAPLESLQPTVSFAAWRTIGDGSETMVEGPYHFAPGKHRNEMTVGGQEVVAIVREDLQAVWTLMPQQNMYLELSIDDPSAHETPTFDSADVVESRFVGNEDVNGHRARRYDVTVRDAGGESTNGSVWVTDDNIPLRMDMSGDDGERVVIELRDVEIGPQSASLFEVPEGYTRLSLGNLGQSIRGLAGAAAAAGAGADASPDAEPEAEANDEEEGGLRDVGRRLRGIFRDR